MKKKVIVGVMVGLLVGLTYSKGEVFKVSAMQNVVSPYLECAIFKPLKEKNGIDLTKYIVGVTAKNNTLDFRFKNGTVESDEKLFIVGIDKVKNEEVFKEYFGIDQQPYYLFNVNIPNYYCNQIELKFYKQKINEGEFPIKEENLIGKTNINMAHILKYQRRVETPLTVYDKNWNVVANKRQSKTALSRITSNLYDIQDTIDIGTYDKIGKIVLPKGQENLMTEEEKIVTCEHYDPIVYSSQADNWQNYVRRNSNNFNLNIPEEVSEFKFLVYENKITDNPEDVVYQYNIKLKRK